MDERVLDCLRKRGATSVEELYDSLKSANPAVMKSDFVELVRELAKSERVRLEDVPPATRSLRQFLSIWDWNLGVYLALAASVTTVVAIYALPSDWPTVVFRWVLGAIFVLLIPGYVAVEALFPKGEELDSIERLALSIALSLAVVPLVGLLLNYTPWGIRLEPIVASLLILTTFLSLVALGRRFRLSVERFDLENLD